MDPISVGLLAALAGGAGGELGRQSWASLTDLLRRPFRIGRAPDNTQAPEISSGEAELIALGRAPADPARAHALSIALAARAAVDDGIRADLEQWYEQARLVRTGDGEVHNTVSGGTQSGPVIQGRDFHGISFNGPLPTPTEQPGGNAPPPQG